jgi:NADPH-dependent 2,4-dienoyl-CoA reductase/sulfur reductase-like enzyme
MSTLIVGASVAGLSTAQALRQGGYVDPITVLGAELHHPYDKPTLSKESLNPNGAASELMTADQITELDIDIRLGCRAVGLDVSSRIVRTADGSVYPYANLVIATGADARTLPNPCSLKGIHTIRTLDDALALRSDLQTAASAVVIGAGFIGAEFASAARAYSVDVTIVEALEVPMSRLLGTEIGATLASLHTANGVKLLTGTGFADFRAASTDPTRVGAVGISDGTVLPADLVVVGIGASPTTGWLAGSGLPVDNGVRCAGDLSVPGFPGIYAAGDVAHWEHGFYGREMRIEHWTNAVEHGRTVAAAILGNQVPAPQVPYVWSDQYGKRIQIVGRPVDGVLADVRGSIDASMTARYVDESGTIVGAVVVDDPRGYVQLRRAILQRSTLPPALAPLPRKILHSG